MSVIAGDPHRILLYPPRNMRESAGCAPAKSPIIGEPEAAPIPSIRCDPFAGRMRASVVVKLTIPAVASMAVVCSVAISCWPRVLRTISSPLEGSA